MIYLNYCSGIEREFFNIKKSLDFLRPNLKKGFLTQKNLKIIERRDF